MARGNAERKGGRRSHRQAVEGYAGNLALHRQQLDGMRGDDPEFDVVLSKAITSAIDLEGRAKRMSREGLSRRAACANIITRATIENTSVTLANERINPMSYEAATHYQPEADGETAARHLHLVPPVGAVAVTEAFSHYDEEATGLDQMPFTD